jgi:type II secretory pathway pseudopilin PulG
MQWRISNKQKPYGFTIVEILIFIAFTGIVLLVVFATASQAQKSRRDEHRKTYARQVFQAMEDYYKNNGTFLGHYDSSAFTRFLKNYLPEGEDPLTGKSYSSAMITDAKINGTTFGKETSTKSAVVYAFNVPHNVFPAMGQIYVATGHVCYSSNPDGSGGPVLSDNAYDRGHTADVFAVVAYLERGKFYCIDNYGSVSA